MLVDRIEAFIGQLRSSGIPVSTGETLDALWALGHVDLSRKESLRDALGVTLIKNHAHLATFNLIFDAYFANLAGQGGLDRHTTSPGAEGDGPDPLSVEDLADVAARGGGDDVLRSLAARAVSRHGAIEPGRPVGGTYYLYRTLRALDLEGVVERLAGAAQVRTGDFLPRRLERERARRWVDRLTAHIEDEIRSQMVAERGVEAVVRAARRPLPENLDFTHAGADDLIAMRKALAPLAARLAARVSAKRRRRRQGSLDFRSTIRHSLAFGGVPLEPRFHRRIPAKPELWVLADVSGSVASFAHFTLFLVHALTSQFSKVRSFAFIDGIDEVTSMFGAGVTFRAALDRVNAQADVVWAEGHSNYGHAFEEFAARWGHQVTSRSTLLVLGDARNNYHATGAAALQTVSARAKRLYWLDPEPAAYWDTGDSIVSAYAPYCDGVYECRNLTQLQAFIDRL